MLKTLMDIPTPYLLVDLGVVRDKYRRLKAALPEAEVFYAMKANSEARIVAALLDEGCGVEVTSSAELAVTLGLGAHPDRIISSNPIKEPRFLTALYTHGIRRMAFDSTVEVDKIARYAPHSQVYLRIQTDNSGSDWPLSGKFGADVAEAPELLTYAASRGLIPYGLTFHVGSQCRNPNNWTTALKACAQIIDKLPGHIRLQVINLGGGLPIQHTKSIPELCGDRRADQGGPPEPVFRPDSLSHRAGALPGRRLGCSGLQRDRESQAQRGKLVVSGRGRLQRLDGDHREIRLRVRFRGRTRAPEG